MTQAIHFLVHQRRAQWSVTPFGNENRWVTLPPDARVPTGRDLLCYSHFQLQLVTRQWRGWSCSCSCCSVLPQVSQKRRRRPPPRPPVDAPVLPLHGDCLPPTTVMPPVSLVSIIPLVFHTMDWRVSGFLYPPHTPVVQVCLVASRRWCIFP